VLEETLHPKTFADKSLPIIPARFARLGDAQAGFVETVDSEEGQIVMRWSDFGAPYLLRLEPNNQLTGSWGVYSCLTPAKSAALSVNGRQASGATFADMMAGHPSSMSCLAWSETWLR
jgi:hypothetical protein